MKDRLPLKGKKTSFFSFESRVFVMPSFFAIWKTFFVLSRTLHSVEGDWNVTPQDQTSGHLTGSSIPSLDGGPSAAAFNPISDPINGQITSNPFPATGMDTSCSDPNQNPPIKKRTRRGNSPPTSCPSFLVPQYQQKPPKNPQQPGGRGQGDNANPSRRPERPARHFRWRPTLEPLKDPCRSEVLTLGLIPVCDSGYIGPTTALAECRYCE